jgi:hypothetical protein
MRASSSSCYARLRTAPPGLAVALGLALAVSAAAPFAMAQTGDKPAPTTPATTPATSSTWSSTGTPGGAGTAPAAAGEPEAAATPDASAKAQAQVVEPPSDTTFDSNDVTELPGKSYYFIGVRYRGTIVPQFMMNLFVNEGRTIYSSGVGLEVDMRKDGFSFIPALSFVEYGMPDTLFLEKNKDANFAGNWSHVSSQLKGVYATADLLWSAKISKNVDFEYGAGFGLGVIFGPLNTNWVRADGSGPYESSDGRKFSPCNTEGEGGPRSGCNKADHQNATVAKVGNYEESSWANGGSKPNIFIHLAIPQFGVRIKPVKQFEGRVGIGFSLTGFWFGLSGNYGLEKRAEKK